MAKYGVELLTGLAKAGTRGLSTQALKKSWLEVPEGVVIDAFSDLVTGKRQPLGLVTPEVSRMALTVVAENNWQQVEALPYVRAFMGIIKQSDHGSDLIFKEDGSTDPKRVDHYANRSLLSQRVPLLFEQDGKLPQIHPLAGSLQSTLPFSLVGVRPITDTINFKDKFVAGKGFNSIHYPVVKLPRYFFSDQDIGQVSAEYSHRLVKAIMGNLSDEPLHDVDDMRHLLAADAGEHLTKEQAEYLGSTTLGKTFERRYTLCDQLLHDLGKEEDAGDKWAEYTRSAYERGTDINHGTTPVKDIEFAANVMRALGVPTVPNQGLGTPLQQGAAGGKKWPFFQEFITRVQEQNKEGSLVYHPNGEPVFLEEGFNFNANGIFGAMSLKGNNLDVSPEAWEAVESYTAYAKEHAPSIYQQIFELEGPVIQKTLQESVIPASAGKRWADDPRNKPSSRVTESKEGQSTGKIEPDGWER